MRKKIISFNLDLSVVNFLEQLSKIENRNKSNLVSEIMKKHYESLTLKQKMKMLRMENFEGVK